MTTGLTPREIVAELIRRKNTRGKIYDLYPEEGPYRRGLYPKHMEVFASGKDKLIRAVQSANGVGKTYSIGGFEVACHLTGLYPDWWPGYRYRRANRWWAAGDTKETTRDTIQVALFGDPGSEGTGLIPADCIEEIKWRSSKSIDYALIKHKSGQLSRVGLKAYEQGEESFRGPNLDGLWLDEPAPYPVYSEAMARLRGGEQPMALLTYTPMDGITELTIEMEKTSPDRELHTITWEDAPHVTEAYKAATLANTKQHLKATRATGVPAIGEGAVYPVDLEDVLCDPLSKIPDHWPRLIGFDGGWHNTAALWGALDRDTDTIYLYSEYKNGEQPIVNHAASINCRRPWPIPVVGDAAAINQSDGEKLIDSYRAAGLEMTLAEKHGKSASIDSVLERLQTGRLRIYRTLVKTISEIRQYRYKDGKIVKENDHLMDCLQYLVRGFESNKAKTKREMTKPKAIINDVQFGSKW